MSLYSYRALAPKAYKNVFLLIRDVICMKSDLDFLIGVRSLHIHTPFDCIPRQNVFGYVRVA